MQAMGKPGPERNEQLVEQLALQIGRWRLVLPSLLFLEVTKPFSFIASQGLLLCQPFMGFFGLGQQVGEYAGLLADRANIDRLIACLEQEMSTGSSTGKEEV
jgi:hypothetical protein